MDEKTENKLESQICWIISPSKNKLRFLDEILSKFEENDVWEEPKIGNIFSQITISGRDIGQIIIGKPFEPKLNNPTYFFSKQHKKNWMYAIRKFILTRINAQFGNTDKNIIIKDQTAIKCLDIILNMLPKSKIIFFPEDGREFVAESLSRMDLIDDTVQKKIDREQDREKLLRYYSTFWDVTMNLSLNAFENHNKELKLMITDERIKNNTNEELELILNFLKINRKRDDTDQMSLNKIYELKYKESHTDEEKVICENIMHTTLENYGYLN